ncbi:inorganic pyrophosphatase [Dichotomocladium elegans]|nr:inorganic pyrophosphatase [Dichotomocladium elegans]
MIISTLLALGTFATAALGAGYRVRQIGAFNTEGFILYLENDMGVPISPFHDVPLHPDPWNNTVYNMIVEIPKWKNAKLEISRDEALNPIYHDTKKGNLRYIANLFPFHGYPGNYGSIPQTWENPNHPNVEVGTTGGDNDPVDVIDISDFVGYPGEVKQVKILGGVLMIDDGTTDWKLIAIDIRDPRASRYNDITDVDPEFMKVYKQWLTVYKVPQGDPLNTFGYNGEWKDHEFVSALLEETHEFWKGLVGGTIQADDISTINLSVRNSPHHVFRNDRIIRSIPKPHPLPDAPIPLSAQVWSFVPLNVTI